MKLLYLYLLIGCIYQFIMLWIDIVMTKQPPTLLKALMYTITNIFLWPIGIYAIIILLRRH